MIMWYIIAVFGIIYIGIAINRGLVSIAKGIYEGLKELSNNKK